MNTSTSCPVHRCSTFGLSLACMTVVLLFSGNAVALPDWARDARPGNPNLTVDDREESEGVSGLAALPSAFSRGSATAAASSRSDAAGKLRALNAVQQSAFHADTTGGRVSLLYGSRSQRYPDANPEGVARSFLRDARTVFGLRDDLSDLTAAQVGTTEQKNHVRFQQTYRGIPVAGATVTVHADRDGAVTLVQNGYRADVTPVNQDILAEAVALGLARDDLRKISAEPLQIASGQCKKQIVLQQGIARYVWEITLPTRNPFGLWVYCIDAENGTILSRQNEILSLRRGVGRVYTSNAKALLGSSSKVALKNLWTEQEAGYFIDPDSGASVPLWGWLWGPYTNVMDEDFNDPWSRSYRFVYDSGTDPDWFHATQGYFALEKTRDWWKTRFVGRYAANVAFDLDNPFNWMTPVLVNVDGLCNAFYSEDVLGWGVPGFAFGNEESCATGSPDLVLDWDVVRHEYTHAMMDWAGFSAQFGGDVDGYGRSMGEGNADWYAYQQHRKDPRIGTVAWSWSVEGALRTLGQSRMYPRDVDYPDWGGPEEHYTGEIWGGYLYDLSRVLGGKALKYVAESYWYFDPNNGFQSDKPDFFDAIMAQILAEYDLNGSNKLSQKAWGAMASRGLNATLRAPYSHASDYFGSGTAGADDLAAFYWMMLPDVHKIVTKGNLLRNDDTHEYPVYAATPVTSLTATVSGQAYGLYAPVVGLYDANGELLAGPFASVGTSVALTATELPAGLYVIRVSGQAQFEGRGYYNFKVTMQ